MSTKNVLSFSWYTIEIVDGRIYKYACYALTQRHALEAASSMHVAARGGLAFATEATVKGSCHDSNCTLGDNCTMTIDRVNPDNLGLTN